MRRARWMLPLLAALALGALAPAAPAAAGQPASRLWQASGAISDETARDLGLRIVSRSEAGTLFEADLESAYRLLERGHFIARAARPPQGPARPHFGEVLTRDLLAARPLEDERRRLIRALVDAVDPDTVREAIRFLSYDEAGGRYRSRFAPRTELKRDITPWISTRLGAYLSGHGGTVDRQDFQPELPAQYRGEDSVFVNLVARLPGRKTGAHYVVCAHYDATAVHDPLWLEAPDAWKTVTAPGANDNATGVAALFETARLLAGLDLDVGLTFIAFSGEELGLLGSDAYAEGLTEADSIIGVINLDMLGHVEGSRSIALTYDRQSVWLSDLLDSTALEAGIASPVVTYDGTATARGDHASFWRAGVPAVMLADAQDGKGNPFYPYYHTTADTLSQVDIEQVCDNARLAVAYLARFAEVQGEPLCDLALTPGSVEWQWEGWFYRPLVAGDSVKAVVRAVNRGGSMTLPVLYGYEVHLGGDWVGPVVDEGIATVRVASGGVAQVEASWTTGPDTYGEIPFLISLHPLSAGVEADLANNSVVANLSVMPPSTLVRNLHVFPNPADRPEQASLRFEILLPESDFTGVLTLSVYDLEGDLAGRAELVRNYLGVKDIEIGINTVPLRDVVPEAGALAPGLYVCVAELAVNGQDRVMVARFKFAVAR